MRAVLFSLSLRAPITVLQRVKQGNLRRLCCLMFLMQNWPGFFFFGRFSRSGGLSVLAAC